MKIFYAITLMIVPLTMVFFGLLFRKHPPKKINATYGYRTKMSMINMDTWRFAHKSIAKHWFRMGIIQIPPSLIPLYFMRYSDEQTLETFLVSAIIGQILLLFIPIIITERSLKKAFDKNGQKRI